MKRILFSSFLLLAMEYCYGQTSYYWVGGATPASIQTVTNWNTSLDGSGSPRSSSTTATDVLIFDGTNIGGATPATGTVIGPVNGGITCAQIKFINNASVQLVRTSTGTGTITVSGDGSPAEDFLIESGCNISFTSTVGSVRIAMAASNTGRVSGNLSMITPLQARLDNTTSGTAGSFRFTSGATFTTNITAASASYAFGNSTQSSNGWVVFEAGSHLYYNGGFSPHGSGTLFSAIDMRPGSTWHHRATNAVSGVGNFFNRQGYGDIIVENNATLNAMGTIYRAGQCIVEAGASFISAASGQTVILGNLQVDGSFSSPALSSNKLVLAGSSAQSISGSGSISLAGLIVADHATVTLQKSLAVEQSVDIYGKLDFGTNQITGNAGFTAAGAENPIMSTGNLVNGAYFITGNTLFNTSSIGKAISGPGLAANTSIVSFSTTADSVYVSQPLQSTASGVSLNVDNQGATLATANSNGFAATGSVATTGNKLYGDSINYIINAANSAPFGISTAATGNMIRVGSVEINAAVTVNTGLQIYDQLVLNGKLSLRPMDTLHIISGSTISGIFSPSNYIVTDYNNGTGIQSIIQYDGLSSNTTIPLGTANYYLPVTINPLGNSDFSLAVFEGITANGSITGTALTATQKQTLVNAVWNIIRLNGTGDAEVQLNWDAALEGSTFTTLPGTDIGLIRNNGSSWNPPIGTGDNTLNTVTATLNAFGSLSAGAVPQVNPFVFNNLPDKTYGDPDFNGGATSLNTTQPIIYSSSNPAVATIVNGDIHITGAGTTDITASQATDGFYPAASVTNTLTVNRAALTIKADDKLKFEGQPNPTLTATYTGLVLGETPAVLLTPALLSTTAVTVSLPGTYPITVSGATSNNYDISFVEGVLTVQPRQSQTITFTALPAKTYGNADFALQASSTNNTIPITYTSSNTNVATINGNMIHITGAGTSTITASQAGNAGYFPATDVSRVLTVNKAALAIRVLDTVKTEGQANPPFTITYTGFVLGETATNLQTVPTVTTAATQLSSAGVYLLTIGGAVSNNYNITYTNGKLTILPPGGTGSSYLNAFMINSSTLTVRVYSTAPALADITIYDMNGRPLAKRNLFMPVGFISADMPVPTIPTGIYIITVRGKGVSLKRTILITK